MQFKPQVWGSLIGILIGVAIMIGKWEALWIPGLALVGYFIGSLIDSPSNVSEKFKDIFRVIRR